jgi:hypothetical protein
MKHILSIMVTMLLLVSAGVAFAQTGGITGVVVDRAGNPVEGARVSLWLDNRCEGSVLTDGSGLFSMADVPVGTYTLKAGKPHFGNVILDGVEVVDGQVTDVGVLALAGGGPHGPQGKFQHQEQYQHGQ